MALCAESSTRGLKELVLSRSMRLMAKVAVAHAHRLVGVGLEELRLGIAVAGIADPVHAVSHHPAEVRAMGIVAGGTHLLAERHMHILEFLILLDLFVAGEAEVTSLCDEKFIVLGGMRPVAGQAAPPAHNGRVAGGHLCRLLRMAGETQFVSVLEGQLGIFRVMGIMA